jgi:hypothetical protein
MNSEWRKRELELRKAKGWTDSWTKTGLTEEEARDIRNSNLDSIISRNLVFPQPARHAPQFPTGL